MRLAAFIRENHAKIVREWSDFARTLQPAAAGMTAAALRDHAKEILGAIADDLERWQSPAQQSEKSKGEGAAGPLDAVGAVHAALRLDGGFELGQLVAEFRALRASVIRLFGASGAGGAGAALDELIRFNEAIDQVLTESVARYTREMDQSRDQFLGILGHDLRNPLGAIGMSARYLLRSEALDAKGLKSAARILDSAERMNRMIGYLLDLIQVRLGTGLPLTRAPVDLGQVCRQVIEELEALYPDRALALELSGELRGEWDGDRLAQVVSNLAGNALQHGRQDTPVRVTARGEGDHVELRIQNEGNTIPAEVLPRLFEPMFKGGTEGPGPRGSLGLGLYIAREIVAAHGGAIAVTSAAETGTTFTVRLPRGRPG
jgi:signal transduction histidine kinase